MTKISNQEAADAYNRVIERYDFRFSSPVTHPAAVELMFVFLCRTGLALFLINEQDDLDLHTLRQFCRQHLGVK